MNKSSLFLQDYDYACPFRFCTVLVSRRNPADHPCRQIQRQSQNAGPLQSDPLECRRKNHRRNRSTTLRQHNHAHALDQGLSALRTGRIGSGNQYRTPQNSRQRSRRGTSASITKESARSGISIYTLDTPHACATPAFRAPYPGVDGFGKPGTQAYWVLLQAPQALPQAPSGSDAGAPCQTATQFRFKKAATEPERCVFLFQDECEFHLNPGLSRM